MNIFITGGTGFLGKAIVASLIDLPRYSKIYLLIRAEGEAGLAKRLDEVAAKIFAADDLPALRRKLVAVRGDLTLPALGIPPAQRAEIVASVQQILHIGASTDFGSPLDLSRSFNVEGTQKVLDLALEGAAAGVFERLDYISTAFVAGTKRGVVAETDLERGQKFSNAYEQTKFEAEQLVRAHQDRLAVAIYRPSIVVGHSETGYTPHFKVLYWPLRLLSRAIVPCCFVNVNTRLDIVPVDYVARAVAVLMTQPAALGRTFHLTSGLGLDVRVRDILKDAWHYAGIKKVPVYPTWIREALQHTPLRRLFSAEFWQVVELASPYDQYFRGNAVSFDSRKSDAFLEDLGVLKPRWNDYKAKVLSFCAASKWGRRLPLAKSAYYSLYRRKPVRLDQDDHPIEAHVGTSEHFVGQRDQQRSVQTV